MARRKWTQAELDVFREKTAEWRRQEGGPGAKTADDMAREFGMSRDSFFRFDDRDWTYDARLSKRSPNAIVRRVSKTEDDIRGLLDYSREMRLRIDALEREVHALTQVILARDERPNGTNG